MFMWQLFVGDVLMYKNTQLVANKGFFYDLPLLLKSIIVRCMQLMSSPTTFLIRVFWLQELVVINILYIFYCCYLLSKCTHVYKCCALYT